MPTRPKRPARFAEAAKHARSIVPSPTAAEARMPLTAARVEALIAAIEAAPGWRVVGTVPWATCAAFRYVEVEASHPSTDEPLLRSRRHLMTSGQWREHRARWDAIREALALVEAGELVPA